MKIKAFAVVAIPLLLGACASVPPPPHCKDDGQGMRPINPQNMDQDVINSRRASYENASVVQGGAR